MREQPELRQTVRISYSGTDLATLRAGWPDEQVFHRVVSKPAALDMLAQEIVVALQEVRTGTPTSLEG